MSGGSGDADLDVKFGSAPTDSSWDCRPYKYGNNETCSFSSPSAGTWHVRIKGYSAFSGVSIVGDYDTGGGGGGDARSEEHTSELQSLMRTSYAVFCLKKKTHNSNITNYIIYITEPPKNAT